MIDRDHLHSLEQGRRVLRRRIGTPPSQGILIDIEVVPPVGTGPSNPHLYASLNRLPDVPPSPPMHPFQQRLLRNAIKFEDMCLVGHNAPLSKLLRCELAPLDHTAGSHATICADSFVGSDTGNSIQWLLGNETAVGAEGRRLDEVVGTDTSHDAGQNPESSAGQPQSEAPLVQLSRGD